LPGTFRLIVASGFAQEGTQSDRCDLP
jgi:hypothetical protein